VVAKRRWCDRQRETALRREEPDRVAADGRLDRESLRLEPGEKLADAPGIEDRSRQRVRADLAPLVDEGDRQLERPFPFRRQARVVGREELPQADGGGEPGRTAADDQDIDFECFALGIAHDPTILSS
jgi:hypothetical protein